MKIGIITYWDSVDNYGQQLQCFALQKFLREMGHEPFLIRYKETIAVPKFKWSKLRTYIKNFKVYINLAKFLRKQKQYSKTDNSLRAFEKFRKENLILSTEIYNRSQLISNPPSADAYVCGSDQIWCSADDIYFLSFVGKNKIKIAYAPSLGGINPFVNIGENRLKDLLNEFKFIGMREKSAAETLTMNGIKDVTHVVDPTLLLSKEVYDEMADSDKSFIHTADCFIYLLGSKVKQNINDIIKFVDSKDYTFTYVASQIRVDKYPKAMLTIPQWIKSIRDSKLVITNSFHCLVFALIYNRPFIFLPLVEEHARMNDRILDLLTECGLQKQICNGSLDSVYTEINFERFEKFKHAESQKSLEILSSLLNE